MMTARMCAGAVACLFGLSACAHAPFRPVLLGDGTFSRADGSVSGGVRLESGAESPRLMITVSGLAPGSYGAHIHAVGRCSGPDFTSAGPHWNPAMRQHGRLNPQGTHAGDLPNLVVAADGRGSLSVPVAGAIDGDGALFDADGAAVVIHAMADDERSDPTGNSGARILCAVLERAEPITP